MLILSAGRPTAAGSVPDSDRIPFTVCATKLTIPSHISKPILIFYNKKAGTPFVGAPAGKWGFYSLDVLLIIC